MIAVDSADGRWRRHRTNSDAHDSERLRGQLAMAFVGESVEPRPCVVHTDGWLPRVETEFTRKRRLSPRGELAWTGNRRGPRNCVPPALHQRGPSAEALLTRYASRSRSHISHDITFAVGYLDPNLTGFLPAARRIQPSASNRRKNSRSRGVAELFYSAWCSRPSPSNRTMPYKSLVGGTDNTCYGQPQHSSAATAINALAQVNAHRKQKEHLPQATPKSHRLRLRAVDYRMVGPIGRTIARLRAYVRSKPIC